MVGEYSREVEPFLLGVGLLREIPQVGAANGKPFALNRSTVAGK